MQPTLEDLKEMALSAGQILREGYGKRHQVEHKGRIDIVTEVDKHSEEYLLREIGRRFPDHSILSEESGQLQGAEGQCWYIDPLDGTTNYAHGIPLFAVMLAYTRQGEITLGVIYEPLLELLFSAERGKGAWMNGKSIQVSDTRALIDAVLATGFPYELEKKPNNMDNFLHMLKRTQSLRRFGSTAINLSFVAAGWLDGYWNLGVKPWDIAAGTLLIEEAGGVVTDLQGSGDYFKPPYAIAAGNPWLQLKILKELKISMGSHSG